LGLSAKVWAAATKAPRSSRVCLQSGQINGVDLVGCILPRIILGNPFASGAETLAQSAILR